MESTNSDSLDNLYSQLLNGNDLKINKGDIEINVRESDIPVTVLNKFLLKAKSELGSGEITKEQYDALKAKTNLILEKKSFTEKIHQIFHKLFAKESSWTDSIQSISYQSKIDTYEADKTLEIESMEQLKKTDFSKYPNLITLNLEGTNIESLPKNINQLTNLKEIHFTSTGTPLRTLPREIGDLTNLKVLDLKNTNITHLPGSICKLQNLEKLKIGIGSPGHSGQGGRVQSGQGGGGKSNANIKENKYLQNLPENIGNLKNLKVLDISDTYIVTLPKSIGNCESLKEIVVNRGNLSSLPDEIGNLNNLEKLQITDTDKKKNSLDTLPDSISNLSSLKELNLNKSRINNLTGVEFPTSLETLKLSGIKEGLSDSIYNCSNLRNLKLYSTTLANFENKDLSSWSNLENLTLKSCKLSSLPKGFSSLSNLKKANLGYNEFKNIPQELLGLQNIQEINLEKNSIENVKDCFNGMSNLEKVSLYLNPLHTVDNSFNHCDKLNKVRIATSKKMPDVTGYVNEAFNDCPKLKSLHLKKMKLTSIESSFKNTQLTKLDISENKLNSIPESVTNCKSLKDLTLSDNEQIKSLPSSLDQLENLENLYASNCSIHEIEELSGMPELGFIKLDKNRLKTLPQIPNIGNDSLMVRLNYNPIPEEELENAHNIDYESKEKWGGPNIKVPYFNILYKPNKPKENE